MERNKNFPLRSFSQAPVASSPFWPNYLFSAVGSKYSSGGFIIPLN
jgi:hypothetical protein